MIINLLPFNLKKIIKQLNLSLVAFLLIVSMPISADELDDVTMSNSAVSVLNAMQKAVLHNDYRIYFVTEEAAKESNTLQYQHVNNGDTRYAQLLYLEGPSKEVVLYNEIVSYFQPESVSFSFPAKRIIEAFPDVIYINFNKLSEYYDFVLLGKARTADRNSKLIRIIPKDKDRYNYVIWIDDESHLPLRIDLLDSDSNIIKQMKVLSIDYDLDKQKFINSIENRDYPILLPIEQEHKKIDSWSVNWLPIGFKENAAYDANYLDAKIDTKLFSDGVFSFTVNVSEALSESSPNVITQGINTIYTTNIDNMNVIIIGNMPRATIEKIAKSIQRQ